MGFQAALAAGYTAKELLNFIAKLYPNFSKQIKNASAAGYTAEQIANFVGQSKKSRLNRFKSGPEQPPPYSPESEDNALIRGSKATEKTIPEGVKNFGKAALGAAGAYALNRIIPSQISRLGSETPSLEQTPNTPEPSETPVISNPQNTNISPPKKSINASDLFKQMDLDVKIQQIASGQPPAIVAKILDQHMLSPSQKKWLKEQTNEPLENLVQQYLSQPSSSDQAAEANITIPEQKPERTPEQKTPLSTPEVKQAAPEPIKEEKIKQAEVSKPEAAKVGTKVLDSKGRLGEISDIRNGIATYRRGKETHHQKVEDIYAEPERIKKAKIVFDPTTVPEELRSAALGMVMVDDENRGVNVMYGPSGEFVKYVRKDGQPIGEKEIQALQEGMTLPITSGEAYMGGWDKDVADSRGSHAVHEFKLKAQEKYPKKPEADDPNKIYWVYPLKKTFTHGILQGLFDLLGVNVSDFSKSTTLARKINEFEEKRKR